MDLYRAGVSGSISPSSDNGPILYIDPNRTSANQDIIEIVLYTFIGAAFTSYFCILPGVRNSFATFMCLTPSLLVFSLNLVALFGTKWHVGQAQISAAYKAFSRDRVQGELTVNIGLNSVNISLRAHRYYILHETQGPIVMENTPAFGVVSSMTPFKMATSSSGNSSSFSDNTSSTSNASKPKQNIKRVNIDINFNERFYWIGPEQMRHEHHNALLRGLPYPILTVVEYLSQDEAGFNWSRSYRSAGNYSDMLLLSSICLCILMFLFHCITPKYAIYAMLSIGLLNMVIVFIYHFNVPSGQQKLVIPFENQKLTFDYGSSFWFLVGSGCIALGSGTLIIILSYLFPNFVYITTILDADYDLRSKHVKKQKQVNLNWGLNQRLTKPPLLSSEKFVEQKSIELKEQGD